MKYFDACNSDADGDCIIKDPIIEKECCNYNCQCKDSAKGFTKSKFFIQNGISEIFNKIEDLIQANKDKYPRKSNSKVVQCDKSCLKIFKSSKIQNRSHCQEYQQNNQNINPTNYKFKSLFVNSDGPNFRMKSNSNKDKSIDSC